MMYWKNLNMIMMTANECCHMMVSIILIRCPYFRLEQLKKNTKCLSIIWYTCRTDCCIFKFDKVADKTQKCPFILTTAVFFLTINFQCFVALSALLAVAAAAPQYPVPIPAPAYGPVPVPAYGPAVVYPDTAPAYNYNYGVADAVR